MEVWRGSSAGPPSEERSERPAGPPMKNAMRTRRLQKRLFRGYCILCPKAVRFSLLSLRTYERIYRACRIGSLSSTVITTLHHGSFWCSSPTSQAIFDMDINQRASLTLGTQRSPPDTLDVARFHLQAAGHDGTIDASLDHRNLYKVC